MCLKSRGKIRDFITLKQRPSRHCGSKSHSQTTQEKCIHRIMAEEKRADGRPISRILSREEVALSAWMIISLGFELPRTSSNLPEDLDRASRCARIREGALPMSSYLALHQATLTVPVMSPPPRWALTPPFHPYLIRSNRMESRCLGHRRFDFCGAGVGLLRLGVTQRPARGVRTFLSMPKHRATIQSSTHAYAV